MCNKVLKLFLSGINAFFVYDPFLANVLFLFGVGLRDRREISLLIISEFMEIN